MFFSVSVCVCQCTGTPDYQTSSLTHLLRQDDIKARRYGVAPQGLLPGGSHLASPYPSQWRALSVLRCPVATAPPHLCGGSLPLLPWSPLLGVLTWPLSAPSTLLPLHARCPSLIGACTVRVGFCCRWRSCRPRTSRDPRAPKHCRVCLRIRTCWSCVSVAMPEPVHSDNIM